MRMYEIVFILLGPTSEGVQSSEVGERSKKFHTDSSKWQSTKLVTIV